MAMTGNAPLPYKKTDETPNLGFVDQSDDIRGGMGIEGLTKLAKFVQEGGTLITEGSTATIFPAYGDHAAASRSKSRRSCSCAARSCAASGPIAKSPLAYGYDGTDLPVYFNQSPVLNAGGGGIPAEFAGVLRRRRRRQRRASARTSRRTRTPLRISPLEPEDAPARADQRPQADARRGVPAAWRAQFGITFDDARPRVVLSFPQNPNDMLLSGTLANGQFLAEPRRARRRAARQGPRRDVRDPPVLALADAGHLLAGLQRDHELERSGRGQGGRKADDDSGPTVISVSAAALDRSSSAA